MYIPIAITRKRGKEQQHDVGNGSSETGMR